MNSLRIAIVGAGIGGLTAALALQQKGFRPSVFEAAGSLGEVGAGLSLPPNATRALEYLGLKDFLDSHADEPLLQFVHHFESGEVLIEFDRHNVMEEYGARYYQIHRTDLHSELLNRVRAHDPSSVNEGHKLVDIKHKGESIALVFSNGFTSEADLVVGCDGLRSTVRGSLFHMGAPDFTGHVAWRGLVPAEDVDGFFSEAASHTWAAPGRLFVHYPIRKKQLVNCVAFSRSDVWAEEGWSIPADLSDLKLIFADYNPFVQELFDRMPTKNMFKWGLFARQPLGRWRDGPITLLGDAAHPMLPYLGSGAAMAIEDAVVLARCLANAISIETALDRYERARKERTAFIQAESNLGGERLQRLDTEQLGREPPRNEDALGIFQYDAGHVEI